MSKKKLCYISFATVDSWLGSAFVELTEAEFYRPKARLDELGINPGGEILCLIVPPFESYYNLPRKYRNRLIVDREEIGRAKGAPVKTLREAFDEGITTSDEVEQIVERFGSLTSQHENEPEQIN